MTGHLFTPCSAIRAIRGPSIHRAVCRRDEQNRCTCHSDVQVFSPTVRKARRAGNPTSVMHVLKLITRSHAKFIETSVIAALRNATSTLPLLWPWPLTQRNGSAIYLPPPSPLHSPILRSFAQVTLQKYSMYLRFK